MRAGTEIEIRLTLIRHGAAKSNLEHRYLGVSDEALSAEGVEWLIQRKENGCYPIAERVFVSPMLRCRQTAEILFPKAEICVIPDWTEIDFGLFEGKNYEELAGNVFYQRWIDSGGTLPFPSGESREAFVKRTMRGFEEMLSLQRARNGQKGQREQGEGRKKKEAREQKRQEEQIDSTEFTAVVHGGTIMALCSSLFGKEYFDYQIGCGEGFVSCFRYTSQGVKLLEFRKI